MFKFKKKKGHRTAVMENKKTESGFPPPNYLPTPLNALCAVLSEKGHVLDGESDDLGSETPNCNDIMGQKNGRYKGSYKLTHPEASHITIQRPNSYHGKTEASSPEDLGPQATPLDPKITPHLNGIQIEVDKPAEIQPQATASLVNGDADDSDERAETLVNGGKDAGADDNGKNALDLTAPASDALLKNRKNAWVQVAGHPGSFAPAGPHTIWKKRMTKENNETVAYQALMNDKAVKNVVPRFYREVEYNGDIFIEIEDLLQHFTDPSIMDIKMGTRTFLESEVKNPVLRKDLYEKMIKLDPNQPTAEEHEQKAITKLRYMQFREQTSSTAELGFRIEAMKMCGESLNHDLKKIKTEDEVAQTFAHFIGHNKDVQQKLIDRLEHIRSSFEASNYFRHHEIIGSSVLILWDSLNHANIWLIDFAKTMRVEGKVLSHTLPWEVGNHETGYLTGVDNLLKIFRGLDMTPVIDEKPDIPESNTEEVPVIVTDTEEIVTEKEELPTETSSHKDDANST